MANRRVTYKAEFFTSGNGLIKHTADLDFLQFKYDEFVGMSAEQFLEKMKSRMFRNDIQHFIQFVSWVKRLSGSKLRFMMSDYGALHLLTHMDSNEDDIKRYSNSVQLQLKKFCKLKWYHYWSFKFRKSYNK